MGLTLKKQLAEKCLFHSIELFSLGPDLIHKCQIRGKEEDTGSLINLENKKFPFSCSLHITRQELMSQSITIKSQIKKIIRIAYFMPLFINITLRNCSDFPRFFFCVFFFTTFTTVDVQ